MQNKQKKNIMTHIVVGYPSIEVNRKLIKIMAEASVKYIELQIPFSDPIADGSTIVNANQRALDNKTKVKDCFELAEESVKLYPNINFLFMTYYNIPFNMGTEKFITKSKEIGMFGSIVPDLPPEEDSENFLWFSQKSNFHPVAVVSPTTSEERINLLSKNTSGLIYSTSRVGITGKNNSPDDRLKSFVIKLKKKIDLPIAVGFGIDSPEKASQIAEFADIIVIGSKVLKLVDKNPNNFEKIVYDFLAKVDSSINK